MGQPSRWTGIAEGRWDVRLGTCSTSPWEARYVSGSGAEGTNSCWKYWFFSGLTEDMVGDEVKQGTSVELRGLGNSGLIFVKRLTLKRGNHERLFRRNN